MMTLTYSFSLLIDIKESAQPEQKEVDDDRWIEPMTPSEGSYNIFIQISITFFD